MAQAKLGSLDYKPLRAKAMTASVKSIKRIARPARTALPCPAHHVAVRHSPSSISDWAKCGFRKCSPCSCVHPDAFCLLLRPQGQPIVLLLGHISSHNIFIPPLRVSYHINCVLPATNRYPQKFRLATSAGISSRFLQKLPTMDCWTSLTNRIHSLLTYQR